MTTKNKIAIIRNGKIIYDTDPTISKPNEMSARHFRESERSKYRRELTQPNDVNFAKAYPDKFKEMYGDETYRLAS